MNNQILSRSPVDGAQESPGAARLWRRGGRWRSAKLQSALVVLMMIASTLLLIGCPGSDDDSSDSETFPVGFRARRFENVMPIVNGKDIVFPTGVMGATGRSTLSVDGITTCTDAANCRGSFVLDGVSGDGEGDSGGETSCFFDFPSGDPDPLDRPNILCLTCDLQVVGECVVEAGLDESTGLPKETVCQVQWLLSDADDDPNAVTSEPFNVTFTINDDGDLVADGVVLVDEDDE